MSPSRDTTDETLIRRHLAGDATAFECLTARHAPGVVGVLERSLGDHHLALDLSQDVFLKLFRFLPRYRFEGHFRSMLYSMALNKARDALRKRQRSRLFFLSETSLKPPSYDPGPERERRSLIEASLGRVPSPFREALYLRDVLGLAYDELAGALGCSAGTAKSRVHRGRMAFKDVYEGLSREDPPQGNQNAS